MLKTMESSLVLRKEMLGLEAGEVQHLGELLVREYNAVAMQCLRIGIECRSLASAPEVCW